MNEMAQQRLIEAATNGDHEMLCAALEAGADINAPDQYGFPPIAVAAHQGRVGSVVALIQAGADLKARVGGRQDTALHRAARYGRFCKRDGRELSDAEREDYLPMVRALLAAGSDVSLESEGRTPLALALEFASVALVQVLVDAGADTKSGAPIVIALRSKRERLAKVVVLLRRGASVDVGAPLTVAAADLDDDEAVDTCRRLLDAAADVDQVTADGWSALTHAVVGENLPLVELLLARGARGDLPINYDEHDAGLSPGMTAARIAETWELDHISAAMDAAGKPAPVDLPLERERLVGRWDLVAVSMDHEGEMCALPKDNWGTDLGAQGGFVHLHPDGRFEGKDMSKLEGTWSLKGEVLVLDDRLGEPQSLSVSMEYGNRQILIAYDDEFGLRKFWFEHR